MVRDYNRPGISSSFGSKLFIITILDVFKQDKIFINTGMDMFSMTKYSDEYERFSERIRNRFSRFYLDGEMILRPKPETKIINFEEWKNAMLSKDLSIMDSNGPHNFMFDGEYKYLDGKAIGEFKTSLLSFPRSGNSMLRNYLESCSGLITGSDGPVSLPFFLD